MKVQRVSRCIALLFFYLIARWGIERQALAALPPRKTRCTLYKSWLAPGHVLTDVGNLAPIGIQSPDLPPSRQSLHRLRNPGLIVCLIVV